MRVLIVQFVNPQLSQPLPSFSNDIGVLASLLKPEGITCHLAAMPGYRPDLLAAAVARYQPQHVLVDLSPYAVTAAHRTIVDLAEKFSLPVAVFGQFATCRPARAMSIPGVGALMLGEYELTAVEFFRAMAKGKDPAGIAGLWMHAGGKLVKGPLRPLMRDVDFLPFADRDLFDYARIVQAQGEAGFKACRGCSQWCAHCLNDWYMDLYAELDHFLRRRSVGKLLEEVSAVVSRYDGIEQVRFYDHAFATDLPWLRTFAADYPKRCARPYRCYVPPAAVSPEVAALLASSLCQGVTVDFGSGSRFIREEVYSMLVSNEQIIEACRTLRDAGLAVTAEVFVGSPYESEITVEETLALLAKTEADEVRAKVYYPTPGTRAAELCSENDWISGRGEENYWLGRSVLNMPSMPPEHIDAVAAKFHSLLKRPGSDAVHKLLEKTARPRKGFLGLLGLRGKAHRRQVRPW